MKRIKHVTTLFAPQDEGRDQSRASLELSVFQDSTLAKVIPLAMSLFTPEMKLLDKVHVVQALAELPEKYRSTAIQAVLPLRGKFNDPQTWHLALLVLRYFTPSDHAAAAQLLMNLINEHANTRTTTLQLELLNFLSFFESVPRHKRIAFWQGAEASINAQGKLEDKFAKVAVLTATYSLNEDQAIDIENKINSLIRSKKLRFKDALNGDTSTYLDVKYVARILAKQPEGARDDFFCNLWNYQENLGRSVRNFLDFYKALSKLNADAAVETLDRLMYHQSKRIHPYVDAEEAAEFVALYNGYGKGDRGELFLLMHNYMGSGNYTTLSTINSDLRFFKNVPLAKAVHILNLFKKQGKSIYFFQWDDTRDYRYTVHVKRYKWYAGLESFICLLNMPEKYHDLMMELQLCERTSLYINIVETWEAFQLLGDMSDEDKARILRALKPYFADVSKDRNCWHRTVAEIVAMFIEVTEGKNMVETAERMGKAFEKPLSSAVFMTKVRFQKARARFT